MKKEVNKSTNVCRLLDAANIKYNLHTYEEETDGEKVAKLLNEDPDKVFKTLVTISNTNEHFVFMVPVINQLDLKKAAKSVGVKSIEMIPLKELLPLTGYVHGGCSPIGMKTKFQTIINDTAILYDEIFCSAGKIGYQIEIEPNELADYVNAKFEDIIK